MALKRLMTRTETRCRFPFKDGYFRVTSVSANHKNSETTDIQVSGYADKEARDLASSGSYGPGGPAGPGDSNSSVYDKSFNVVSTAFDQFTIPAGTKPSEVAFVLAYLWLKTQPDFAGAEDC